MSPRFPQDLAQADDVHCSVDALLLAAFVAGDYALALDLGAGCGVVGLGLLLRGVAARVIGLEKDEAQLEAARSNARFFDVESKYSALRADFTEDAHAGESAAGDRNALRADLVVCNPPWRLMRSQRLPASPRRCSALYGTEHTLEIFVQAGAVRLVCGGRYAAVVGAERLPDMVHALGRAGLCPARLRFVHPRAGRDAAFVLIEARYAVQCRLRVEPPLMLHEKEGYTEDAHSFCPWL